MFSNSFMPRFKKLLDIISEKANPMKNTIAFLWLLCTMCCSAQKSEIKPYVRHLEKVERKSAKDYIIEQFKDNDIVILCERDHRDLTQYELIKEVLSDDYFKKHVKNLFTEIGVINLQPEITEFLKTKGLDSLFVENKLKEFQFNSSFWVLWEKYNYHYLLRTIYDINNSSDNQISYYPSDSEFDWQKVNTKEDYLREQDFEIEPRDSIMAYNIINTFEGLQPKGNKKALVILNYRHAFKMHLPRKNGEIQENAAKYLFDYFGERATNILIHQAVFRKKEKDYAYALIQNGKWDASLKALNIEDVGFDLAGTAFGKDQLDLWSVDSSYTYEDAFDGYVFFKPIEEYQLVSCFDGFIPKEREEEFIRRFKIQLEYQEETATLEKLNDADFRKAVLIEMNTKRVVRYPNIEELIEVRDNYIGNQDKLNESSGQL